MRGFGWAIFVCLGIFPLTALAQQPTASKPPSQLNDDTQKLGQRVFQQRCGICHDQARPGFVMYGPALYKDLVNGSEDAIKEIIGGIELEEGHGESLGRVSARSSRHRLHTACSSFCVRSVT